MNDLGKLTIDGLGDLGKYTVNGLTNIGETIGDGIKNAGETLAHGISSKVIRETYYTFQKKTPLQQEDIYVITIVFFFSFFFCHQTILNKVYDWSTCRMDC